jgi:hypothetical protein
LEVTALLSMMRQTAGAMHCAVEPKQMLIALVRMFAILSGKMTALGEAIELHGEP